MKQFHMATWLLVVIGALNWGLVALLDVNLVKILFGMWPMVERLVYVFVGLSAVVELATHMQNCKVCGSKK